MQKLKLHFNKGDVIKSTYPDINILFMVYFICWLTIRLRINYYGFLSAYNF